MLSDRQLWVRSVVVLVVLLGATAAALLLHPGPASSPKPRPTPSGKRPFPQPGESERYTLSMGDVAAGELRTDFERADDGGHEGLEFKFTVSPTGALQYVLHYKLTGSTLLDPRTLQARSGSFTSQSDGHDKITTVRFDPSAGKAAVEINKPDKKKIKHKTLPIGVPLDVPAALVLLRTGEWTAEPRVFRVINGDKLYQWKVSYVGSETVEVPAGRFDTDVIRVETRQMKIKPGEEPVPKDETHTVRVWLATDTGVPVRVQVDLKLGTFRAELQ